MKKMFKVFLAGVLTISMFLSTSTFATGELNLCGSYAQVAPNGSILSYADGSFSSGGTYAADKVSSGFCSVNTGSGETTDATGSVLTYPTGVGGRAADDISVRLTSTTSNSTALSVGEIAAGKTSLASKIKQLSGIGNVVVVEFDFYAEGEKDRSVHLRFSNNAANGTTLTFTGDLGVKRAYRAPGNSTVVNDTLTGVSYELGKWNRVRLVRDLTDVAVSGQTYNANKDYIFLNGVKIVDSSVYDTSTEFSYVTFTQAKGSASMCIDDVEIYVASSLDAALSTDKTAAELVSKAENCVIDNINDTIIYTSSTSTVALNDLKSVVTGNISGIYREGALLTGGNLADGDTIIVCSEDGRTFGYYTLNLAINLTNIASSATIVSGVTQKSDSTVNWDKEDIEKMFDDNEDTYLKAGSANLSGEFIIDLTTIKGFNRITIYKPEETPRTFNLTVQVSDDNKNWVDAMRGAVVPNEKETELIYNVPKVSGRYVKFCIHDITVAGSSYGFAISELGLYYDSSLPKITSYRCLLSKNTDNATKLNARVEASAAVEDSLCGVLVYAVYGSDDSLIEAKVMNSEFSVSQNSEYSHTYEIDLVQGAKYAKVFFWNNMMDIVPAYKSNEYK